MINKDYLIYLLIEDIKHLTKEIVALRYELIDRYPDLKYELLSDLTPFIKSTNESCKYVDSLKRDFFDDDKEYLKELKELQKTGKSKKYPFSI